MEIGNKNAVHVENLRRSCHISSEIQSGKIRKISTSWVVFLHLCVSLFKKKNPERHSLCNFWHLIKYSNGTFAKTTRATLMFSITQTSFTLDIP